MNLYIVSTQPVLDRKWGYVELATSSYDKAFEQAKIGHYIHVITVSSVEKVIHAGKMVVRWTDGDPE